MVCLKDHWRIHGCHEIPAPHLIHSIQDQTVRVPVRSTVSLPPPSPADYRCERRNSCTIKHKWRTSVCHYARTWYIRPCHMTGKSRVCRRAFENMTQRCSPRKMAALSVRAHGTRCNRFETPVTNSRYGRINAPRRGDALSSSRLGKCACVVPERNFLMRRRLGVSRSLARVGVVPVQKWARLPRRRSAARST